MRCAHRFTNGRLKLVTHSGMSRMRTISAVQHGDRERQEIARSGHSNRWFESGSVHSFWDVHHKASQAGFGYFLASFSRKLEMTSSNSVLGWLAAYRSIITI